jgi:orotidine-5'-phosphate decarboxylase
MAEIIVALDLPNAEQALRLVTRLHTHADFFKVATPLFTAAGPDFVRELRERGKRVFLDLKFHDIPNTVAGAVAAACTLDVQLLTVHASGGAAMLAAARRAAAGSATRVLGVTVLTSFDGETLGSVWGRTVEDVSAEVDRLAGMTAAAGLDGVVASPLEVAALKRRYGTTLTFVTPGIRPAGSDLGDQARVATPVLAAQAGADFLVIGRPVLEANEPAALIDDIRNELAALAVA